MATSVSRSSSNDLSKAIAFFSGAEMPARVWSRKYRLSDRADNYLEDSPLQTFCRLADAIGAAPDSTLRQNLVERRFIPAGRILFALGNPYFNATQKNCLTGDTMVMVEGGNWRRLDEIADHGEIHRTEIRIDGEVKKSHAWSNGIKKIVQVTTKEGFAVKSTPDHKFRLEDGTWCVAGQLTVGDLLDLGHHDGYDQYGDLRQDENSPPCYQHGYATGLFIGDGTFAGDGFKVANVRLFGQKAHVPINLIASVYGGKPIIHEDHVSYNSVKWARVMEDCSGIYHNNKTITDAIMGSNPAFQAGFLRGFFDADGSVTFVRKKNANGVLCTTRTIVLGQSDLTCLRRVQQMLLGFGIKGKIYKNGAARSRNFGDRGVYECRAAWVLNITRESFKVFVEKIGFSHPDKAAKASAAVAYGKFKRENWFARVESVEDAGEAEVFDMSVDDIHAFNANGLIAHNCYVLALRDDSLEAISDLRKEMARTYAMGGGVGIDLTPLRPAGAPVKNSAITSSGAASFADGFSHLTGEIGQNGRRGALMISLSVDHPDIERFISQKNDFSHSLATEIREKLPRALYKKLNEEVIEPRRSCANANMSVRITDRFMQAVKDGKHHITRFVMDDGQEITEVFDAKKLFRKIVEGAWGHGCPGCLFWDTMAREDNRNYLDSRWHIVTTNPCVVGETRLATQHGMVKMEDLHISGSELKCTVDTRALGSDKGTTTRPAVPVFITSESEDVWEVTTKSGHQIKATAWHDFYTTRGKIELKDLVIGDDLLIQSGKGQFGQEGNYDLGFLMGLIAGDGHFTNRGKNKQAAVISLWGKDRRFASKVVETVNEMVVGKVPYARRVSSVVVEERDEERVRSIALASLLKKCYGFCKETKLRVPEVVWRGNEACAKGYLHGLFQADGTVNVSGHDHSQSCSIRLASSTPAFLRDVQMLVGNFGIYSAIYKRREAGQKMMPDGKGDQKLYNYKPQYELIIDGESRDRFMDEIGFADDGKRNRRYQDWAQDKVLYKSQRFTSPIVSIEYAGKHKVYDTTQKDHNTVVFNGLATGQCGEQPLGDGGSCLHPDTLLTTSEGLRRIETFDKGVIATASGTMRPVGINYGNEIAQQAIAFKTDSNRPIVKVTVDGGMALRTTPDHIFMTNQGEVRADKLVESDAKVRWMNSNPLLTPVDLSTEDVDVPLMLGWMHGDGWMTESSIGISFNYDDGDFDVKDRILGTYFSCFGERKPLKDDGVSFQVQTETKAAYEVIERFGVYLEKAGRRRLPRAFFTMSFNHQLAFLAGIFTADGWVQGKNNAQIGYSSSSPVLVEELQQVLGGLGIQSRLYSTDFDNGRNTQYRIAITKGSARRFMDYIGFATAKKQADFNWEGARFSDKEWLSVLRVEDDGVSDVYDFTVPTTHTGFANGVLVHNCNLGALNLARFTKYPYTERAEFDWADFKQAIRDGVRFLDEINTVELEENRAPLSKQAEVTEGLRQIGLGVMGYGDLLLQHQIKYASDEALVFTDKLFRTLRDTAYHESIMLAKEKGPFPAFDWEKIKRSPFIDRLPAELKKLMKEHGLRNSNVLSIAPTGTIAIMGETTGGIEPEFAFQLTRAAQLGTGKRTKFTFLTPTAQRIAKALGKSIPQGEIEGAVDMSWLPDWAIASHQIDPKRRAKVQGLVQQYIDTAISSTVNLPESATVEDVMDVYWSAYEAGCKGVTIYREGSREGILQTLQEEERLEYPIDPPLSISSKRISFKGEHGLQRILINLGDYKPGVPCEVSVIHGKSGTEVASYASALGIVASIALQNGVHPIKLARAMEGISAGWATRLPLDGKGKKPTTVQSVPDAIAATLRKFYDNGIYEKGVQGKPINGETNQIGWELTDVERNMARICPKCQKQTYIPDSSCWKCINPACDVDGICG